jgi:hypothetical protein
MLDREGAMVAKVPESVLKKRQTQEKLATERASAAALAKKVSP